MTLFLSSLLWRSSSLFYERRKRGSRSERSKKRAAKFVLFAFILTDWSPSWGLPDIIQLPIQWSHCQSFTIDQPTGFADVCTTPLQFWFQLPGWSVDSHTESTVIHIYSSKRNLINFPIKTCQNIEHKPYQELWDARSSYKISTMLKFSNEISKVTRFNAMQYTC